MRILIMSDMEGVSGITIEVESVDKTSDFRGRPNVEIAGPLKVLSRGETWMQAWDQIWGY